VYQAREMAEGTGAGANQGCCMEHMFGRLQAVRTRMSRKTPGQQEPLSSIEKIKKRKGRAAKATAKLATGKFRAISRNRRGSSAKAAPESATGHTVPREGSALAKKRKTKTKKSKRQKGKARKYKELVTCMRCGRRVRKDVLSRHMKGEVCISAE